MSPRMPLAFAGEWPGALDRLLELEPGDQRFMNLAGAHDAVTGEIQEIETGIELACQAYLARRQRRRAYMKAELLCLPNG